MRSARPKTLTRLLLALVCTASVISLASCIQVGLPEGATAEHRYFAAVADYTTVKVIAAEYAAQPDTPVGHAEAILKVAEDGDRYVHAVDAVRRGDCTDADLVEVLPDVADGSCVLLERDYESAAGALRVTSSILRKLATEEE